MDITTNKKYRTFLKTTRYSNTPIMYNMLDKKYQCGISKYIDKQSVTYKVHVIQPGDTLDTLSLYYYGNPIYYWVIADFNDIFDPFESLQNGAKILIPSLSSVQLQV